MKHFLIGPWSHTNERGTILVGVHVAGSCWEVDVPHYAVRLSNPAVLHWITETTGKYFRGILFALIF